MNDCASPATWLHDVVVIHEQSGAQWRAGNAHIREGRIVVAAKAPNAFFDSAAATFRIHALDGADRVRCFLSLVLIERALEEYVFD